MEMLRKKMLLLHLSFLLTGGLLDLVALNILNPLPNDKSYTLPNWKSLQTTISNLMEMAGSPSKWVENTVGKGEIARNEQFLLFP